MSVPEPHVGRTGRKRKFWIIALAIPVVAVAGALAYRETRTTERDRHAVRAEMEDIERAIRAHDADIWRRVEADHDGRAASSAEEETHQQMLRDFDRLGHLDGLSMDPVAIEIGGDVARVNYRVQGVGRRRGDPPPPTGEFRFSKGRDGKWRMTAHRLIEGR
jgi:hypothetical protein